MSALNHMSRSVQVSAHRRCGIGPTKSSALIELRCYLTAKLLQTTHYCAILRHWARIKTVTVWYLMELHPTPTLLNFKIDGLKAFRYSQKIDVQVLCVAINASIRSHLEPSSNLLVELQL